MSFWHLLSCIVFDETSVVSLHFIPLYGAISFLTLNIFKIFSATGFQELGDNLLSYGFLYVYSVRICEVG